MREPGRGEQIRLDSGRAATDPEEVEPLPAASPLDCACVCPFPVLEP